MTQTHSCRSSSSFSLSTETSLFQINCMESLRILERGSQYTLVRHNLARWIPLFLCHFFDERRQRHNLFDRPRGSESIQFNVKMISFLEIYWLFDVSFSTRPTLVLEVVLSCRLILNLRSAAVEGSAFKTKPAILPWSDNSKTRSYNNPSSSIILGDQSRSTELQVSPKFGKEMKLEPNRARPESTWNAQTLYKY